MNRLKLRRLAEDALSGAVVGLASYVIALGICWLIALAIGAHR